MRSVYGRILQMKNVPITGKTTLLIYVPILICMRGNTIHILIPCATIKTNRLTMKTEIGGISKK